MARTITKLERTEYAGDLKVRKYEVDITSYTTGGEDLTPGDFRLNRFITLVFNEVDGDVEYANYDTTNQKMQVYDAGGELASSGTATFHVTAFGK